MYALAATFYYAVTGQVPPDSIDRVDSDALVLPSKLGVEVSAQQEKALSSGLSVLPENRFQSVRDLRSALYDGRKMVLFRKGKKKPRSIFWTILLAANVVVAGFFAIIFILAALRSIVYTVTDEPYGEGVYSGEWRNNAPSGQGAMVFTNGDRYEGEWSDKQKNGIGILSCADGDRYDGSWNADQFLYGTVKITYENGDQYEGGWLDGARNDTGTMTCANGACYEGEWLMDEQNGAGTMTYANGIKLTASKWRGNTVFTDGTEFVTLPDGSQHEPIWIDGKLALDGY